MTKLKKGILAAAMALCLLALIFGGILLQKAKISYAEEVFNIDGGNYETYLDISEDGDSVILNGFKTGVTLPSRINLEIPEDVTEIKASAFAARSEIMSITLPESLQTIGNKAFENCTGLVEVYNKSAINLSAEGTTSTAYGYIVYYALNVYTPVSGESKLAKTDDGYLFCVDTRTDPEHPLPYLLGTTSDATELTLPTDYEGKAYAIFQYAFWNYNKLTSVDAGNANITAIGNFAFYQCTSLGSITLPDSVTIIGYSAFTGCTQLTSIDLPANLETIVQYAFSGCTALSGSITIPAAVKEIGNNAFYNCSALQEVIFEDGDTPLDIGQQAFRGCAELTVVTLPERLNSINRLAFADCAKLGFAYMPAGVTYNGVAVLDNSYFGTNTAIIFKNYAAYEEACNKNYIKDHASQLTYIVGIEFNGGGENGEGGAFGLERLAGRAFNYVKSPDGSWALSTETDLDNLFPAQEGYLTSVWYSDAACETKVSASDVDSMLAIENQNDTITLYAIYKAKPVLTLKTNVTYSETSSYEWTEFIEEELDNGVYTVELSGEGLVDGKAANAGDYTLTVNLDEKYGVWSEALSCTVTVNRKAVDLSTLAEWNGLEGGTIYVYRNGEENEIYSGAQLSAGNIPEGYTYYRTLTVVNSVAKYTDGEITVDLHQNIYYTIGDYTGNKGTEEGKYTAQVTLTASNNYRLTASAPVNTESGYTITISADQDSATVEKEWYIIKSGNLLYIAGSTDAYSISGWTYNSDVARVAPDLQHPANITGKPFTFNLTLAVSETTTTAIGTSIGIENFGDYVNGSMPAGNYIITFNIPDVNGNDGNIEFFARQENYSFTVTKADIKDEWISDINAKLTDRTEIVTSTAKLYNKSNTTLAIWSDSINDRKGIWQNETYNNYYSEEFALTYNLYRMQSNEYLPYTEVVRDWLTTPDTYTVYYQFTAENYNPLVDTADDSRRECSFKVTLYDVVTIPEISSLVYTGSELTPVIAANPLYTAEYNTAEYVNAGTHSVTLTLTDSTHYKWIKGGEEQTDAEVQVQFEINRADNRVNVNLSIAQWTYGDYNEEVNVPSWGVVFFDGEDADFYTYTLKQRDGENIYTQDKFGEAPIGWYILTATAKGYIEGDETTAHYNWNALTDGTYEIYISKGINTWSVTPNVMQWNYRNYDREVNLILAEAKIDGGNEVNFKVTSDDKGNTVIEGLESFTAKDGVVDKEVGDILAGLNVGTYYLWASVDSTADYEGIDPSQFQFKVSVAENTWKTAPEIKSWIVGKYDAEENKVLFESQFNGEESIVITVAGNEEEVIYDSVNGIDNLKDAKVGVYELKVTVKGTSDFNDLTYTFVFNVFDKEGMPWWATLLIVVGALGIVALVLFILHQKGVLQMLTGKFIIAMRTRAAVDATIAAVRASKVAARAKITVAAAEAKDAAEARQKAQPEAKTDELNKE